MRSLLLSAVVLSAPLLSACATRAAPTDAFFSNLKSLCGQTLTGAVVSDQAVDADWRGEVLRVGPVACTDDTVRMALAVGADMSREWVVERLGDDVRFLHYHTEPDGSPSAVTRYGGTAEPGGSATVQRFGTDAATRENFAANGIARSIPNIWTLRVDPAGRTLAYSLERPATATEDARDFRAEFTVAE